MKKNIKDVLKPGCHIHLMGICGTAMASLAGLLKERGYKVTGSDSHPYPPMSTQLENLGIAIQKPYAAVNLNPRPDFVIVGNVISANNEEAQELLKLGIPYSSLPQALGDLMLSERQSIVVSGTHGKTTTTSLMAWIAENQLKAQQAKPGFLIGGIPKNFSKSFQNPESDFFIIEGDEYDTAFFDKVPKFTHYHPKHVILTSIEFDHADIYQDLNAVKSAFQTLINLIPQEGTLIWSAKDQNISSLVTQSQGSGLKAKNVFSYGIGIGDFKAQVLESKFSRKRSWNFSNSDDR
jgi:UDP-N-acetylmuramate: L-alanyl-gamma-D-glutamyl-meso-diaminopimelate ligase